MPPGALREQETPEDHQQTTAVNIRSCSQHAQTQTRRHTQTHTDTSFSSSNLFQSKKKQLRSFSVCNDESRVIHKHTNAHSIHCLAHYCILVFDKHLPSTVQTYRSVYLLQTDTPVKDFCWIFA